jgi:predicted O-linked N-acetylglucosamine transferase (SPINDLY family)
VLTLEGGTFAGRVAASLLYSAGLEELVCGDVQTYVDAACRLGSDPEALAGLRVRLSHGIPSLFDAPRLARELEALFLRMWAHAETGLPPQALAAEPGTR